MTDREFEELEPAAEVEGAPAVPAAPVAQAKKPSVFSDPVVKWLSIGLGVIVIAFLGTILAALLMGILGSDKPRTSTERDLQAYQYQIDSGSQDPEVWKAYIGALIDTDQMSKAQQVIDRGLTALDNEPGADMTLAQATLYLAEEKFDDAAASATEGINALTAYHEARKATDDTPESKGQPISENYWALLFVRASAYAQAGELDKAVADMDEYLAERRGDSDVYVLRGDTKAALGDRAGAEEDYRRALSFIKDHPGALDGLKKLGVAQ